MRTQAYLEYIAVCSSELSDLRLYVMFGGEDWHEPVAGSAGISKPTEAAALRRMDVAPSLARAEKKIARLEVEIGECLVLLRGVRLKYGALYADVLEMRYVDLKSWRYIAAQLDVAVTTARRCCAFACKRVDLDGWKKIRQIGLTGLDGGTPKR